MSSHTEVLAKTCPGAVCTDPHSVITYRKPQDTQEDRRPLPILSCGLSLQNPEPGAEDAAQLMFKQDQNLDPTHGQGVGVCPCCASPGNNSR